MIVIVWGEVQLNCGTLFLKARSCYHIRLVLISGRSSKITYGGGFEIVFGQYLISNGAQTHVLNHTSGGKELRRRDSATNLKLIGSKRGAPRLVMDGRLASLG